MDENIVENNEPVVVTPKPNNQMPIVGAIVLAGALIAGAVLLNGSRAPQGAGTNNGGGIPVTVSSGTLSPVNESDRTLGNKNAKVTLVMYEDFQCPFCGAINGLEPNNPLALQLKQQYPGWAPIMPTLKTDYIDKGTVQYVYRDFSFLGPESNRSAEAARCAGDQGKFWEYHDYLYSHQNGENKGSFSDDHLKTFAQTLGLNTATFGSCLDTNKYAQAVADSKSEGANAGVTGTPKGFILSSGKLSSTIDGAESWSTVKTKIDAALK